MRNAFVRRDVTAGELPLKLLFLVVHFFDQWGGRLAHDQLLTVGVLHGGSVLAVERYGLDQGINHLPRVRLGLHRSARAKLVGARLESPPKVSACRIAWLENGGNLDGWIVREVLTVGGFLGHQREALHLFLDLLLQRRPQLHDGLLLKAAVLTDYKALGIEHGRWTVERQDVSGYLIARHLSARDDPSTSLRVQLPFFNLLEFVARPFSWQSAPGHSVPVHVTVYVTVQARLSLVDRDVGLLAVARGPSFALDRIPDVPVLADPDGVVFCRLHFCYLSQVVPERSPRCFVQLGGRPRERRPSGVTITSQDFSLLLRLLEVLFARGTPRLSRCLPKEWQVLLVLLEEVSLLLEQVALGRPGPVVVRADPA